MPMIWLRFLPTFIRTRIEYRPGLQKILANTGWLFADKILRLGVGLVVVIWVARYLGPEQFGLINYAMAFVALFGSVATLGFNGIVVRDLVNKPETANATLGTAFILQVMGGFLAFGLAVFAISFARPDNDLAKLMVAVLSFVMVFKSTEVVKYWFESQVKSMYSVWVENGAFLAFAAVKIILILTKAKLMAFVWATFAEGALVAIGLLSVYAWRGGKLNAWQPHYQRAQSLLKDSWPLIISGLAIMVYMRIDQIMIGQMLGDKAVGVYSAAVKISEIWYFIPIAICASVFPTLLEAKKKSEELYYRRLQKLYDLMVILALMVAIPMTFLSNLVVNLLFGDNYMEAGGVLAIHIWAGLFVFLGVAGSRWFLAENLQKITFFRTCSGGILNIFLNWLLIPFLGVVGAAIATVVSQATASVLLNVIMPKTRAIFIMQMKSLLFFSLAEKIVKN